MENTVFTMLNTEGFSQEKLDDLNEEFNERYNAGEYIWNDGTKMTPNEASKYFMEEVTGR